MNLVRFALFIVCVFPLSATGNDAPLRQIGKTVLPTKDVEVQMISEKVEISIDYDIASIVCTFVLRNLGKPGTIEVGFPFGKHEGDVSNFRVGIANSKVKPSVKVKESRDPEYPRWQTFKIQFAATGEEVKVYNSYSARLHPAVPAGFPYSDLVFRYVLKTGAFWSGPIENAKVIVHFKNVEPDQCTEVSPSNYTWNGSTLMWAFKDFEPIEDIEIRFLQSLIYHRIESSKLELQINGEDPDALYTLGTAYFHVDRFKGVRAEGLFRKAIAIAPEHLDSRWFLSLILAQNPKTPAEAIAQLDTIVSVDRDYECFDAASVNGPRFANTATSQLEFVQRMKARLEAKAP